MIRPLVLGGMVYGQTYLDIFERFCVASLRAPANLEALFRNDAKLVLCTTQEDAPRLRVICRDLPHELYMLPEIEADVFQMLAGAQAGLVEYAADRDCAFHMLMPDVCYSEAYFPNLFRLAELGDVLHNGLNASPPPSEIELYRRHDALNVSANTLGDMAWEHLHPRMSAYLMNRAKVPTSMPPSHFHLWRARDRAMLFSSHNSPVYLTPETARRYHPPPIGTLDTEIQWMVGNFVCPSIDDDMVMIGIEHKPVEALPYVDWFTFAKNCWGHIGIVKERLEYFRKPIAEVPAAVIEGAPTVADVLERQGKIADGLEEWGIVGAAA